MGDYRRDEVNTMLDLDLNQEPLDLPEDMIFDHNGVEERIRQLEAVYARARWRQTRNTVDDVSVEGREAVERTDLVAKGVKRDSSHLVAKALELDMGATKVVGDGEGFFDCNICLDTVREPILTCCGHLFCWGCFYKLPYVYSSAKECPVCKGEVTDSNVTPIYGNGKAGRTPESTDCGDRVPPRPRANRVESIRQSRVARRVTSIPVADALRRIRIGLGGGGPPPDIVLAAGVGAGARRHRTRLVGRALSEADTLVGLSDEVNRGPHFGFVFDSPVIGSPTEANVNDPMPPPSSRRRNRVRRRAPRS